MIEPNVIAPRPISEELFLGVLNYADTASAFGRGYGLLPGCRGWRLPFQHPIDVLRLPTIRAIGMHGRPLEADSTEGRDGVEPLDTVDIEAGNHTVYAALTRERREVGELVEFPSGNGQLSRMRTHRERKVRLVAGDQRLSELDWLPVAEITRERQGGTLRTILDPSFHPPILSMAAYSMPNPAALLATRLLSSLETATDSVLASQLRAEAVALGGLAETGSPEVVFGFVLRCLQLLREAKLSTLNLDGRLTSYRYSPDRFCVFLADLLASLDRARTEREFPTTLEVGGTVFTKVPGELVEDGGFWRWDCPEPSPMAINDLAILISRATPQEVPVVSYGLQRSDAGDFALMEPAPDVSAAGTLLKTQKIQKLVDKMYFTVAAQQLSMRLGQLLRDGHAIYRT